MSATFTWKILGLECYPTKDDLSNVVSKINWECKAEQGGFYINVERSTVVQYKAGGPFTPFDQLTSAQVLEWVHNHRLNPRVAKTTKQLTEEELQAELDKLTAPTTVSVNMPWDSTTEVTPPADEPPSDPPADTPPTE